MLLVLLWVTQTTINSQKLLLDQLTVMFTFLNRPIFMILRPTWRIGLIQFGNPISWVRFGGLLSPTRIWITWLIMWLADGMEKSTGWNTMNTPAIRLAPTIG